MGVIICSSSTVTCSDWVCLGIGSIVLQENKGGFKTVETFLDLQFDVGPCEVDVNDVGHQRGAAAGVFTQRLLLLLKRDLRRWVPQIADRHWRYNLHPLVSVLTGSGVKVPLIQIQIWFNLMVLFELFLLRWTTVTLLLVFRSWHEVFPAIRVSFALFSDVIDAVVFVLLRTDVLWDALWKNMKNNFNWEFDKMLTNNYKLEEFYSHILLAFINLFIRSFSNHSLCLNSNTFSLNILHIYFIYWFVLYIFVISYIYIFIHILYLYIFIHTFIYFFFIVSQPLAKFFVKYPWTKVIFRQPYFIGSRLILLETNVHTFRNRA